MKTLHNLHKLAFGIALFGSLSCKSKRAAKEDRGPVSTMQAPAAQAPTPMAGEAHDRNAKEVADKPDKGVDEKKRAVKVELPAGAAMEIDVSRADGAKNETKKPADDHAQSAEGPARAWFPETFLFEPLVVTDDHGAATVPVRVPDRLTTWHVLALAHSRSGAQGGTTASFLGTLPAYVDPVIPPFLVMGDEIKLPIQMINTTPAAIASTLSIEADNAAIKGAQGARTIPAQGSLLEYATLSATRLAREG